MVQASLYVSVCIPDSFNVNYHNILNVCFNNSLNLIRFLLLVTAG